MVDERTAYWGERDAARYRTQDDDPTGGDYVVAETLDANGDPVDVLLRWDDTAGEWVSGGPVNMSGSDVTNVGALDADSLSTGEISLTSSLLNNKSLVDSISVSNSPVSSTISLSGNDTAGYIIDVGGIFDSASADSLDLTIDGISTDYDWTEEDSDGGFTTYTDQSEFRLADSGANFNTIRGAWIISKPRSRLRITQIFATHGQLGSRPVLYDGENTSASNFDSLTLSTSSDMSEFSADIVQI